jgi:predicted O-linked N-acetylglucosamine transferase (SPINDLY family)
MLESRLQAAYKLLDSDQHAAAKRDFLSLVAKHGSDFRVRIGLARAMFRLGERAAAAFHAEHALRLAAEDEPRTVEAIDVLARVCESMKLLPQLEAICHAKPHWRELRLQLAAMLIAADRIDDADRLVRDELAADPNAMSPRTLMAGILAAQGRAGEALDMHDTLLRNFPPTQQVLEASAFASNAADTSPSRVFAAHDRLGRFFARHAAEAPFRHPPTDDPERPLKIAFVSHDLVGHSVSFFLEPLLRHLRRPGLTISAYHTGPTKDRTTDLLAPLVDAFVHVPSISSVNLARRVRDDGIDVLIDLNGWTEGHRLHAFQLRPAPLQMTYLGYPNTTGLPEMDVRIVDAVTDPPGAERFATERLARLDPCFLCYSPVTRRSWIVPPDWQPPARPDDHFRPITFGSFNNLTKVTDRSLRTWAEILKRTPGSTLLVKGRGLRQGGSQAVLSRRLEQAGMPPEAWTIMPPHERPEDHLAAASVIDIALDTFPYNGTTTTCELLSLGVPVVTLRGDRHVARVGASILEAAGLHELVAEDEQSFVCLATELAADRPRLRALQAGLAARFLGSPVCDGPAFADRFAQLIRDQWRLRCGRQP